MRGSPRRAVWTSRTAAKSRPSVLPMGDFLRPDQARVRYPAVRYLSRRSGGWPRPGRSRPRRQCSMAPRQTFACARANSVGLTWRHRRLRRHDALRLFFARGASLGPGTHGQCTQPGIASPLRVDRAHVGIKPYAIRVLVVRFANLRCISESRRPSDPVRRASPNHRGYRRGI
jgi:hypothetical protein